MNSLSRYIAASGLALAALLAVTIAACDAVDRSGASVEGAVRLNDGEVVEPLAHFSDGELKLLVSEEEARQELLEVGRKLVQDIEEVRFEDPVLQVTGGIPLLTMRGTRPDGNCVLAYLELGTVREGNVERVKQLDPDHTLPLYKTPGGTCTGNPCNGCHLTGEGGHWSCVCHGTGPGGEPGFCNHSTG